jgi:hemolysin-activating ACP:hemolysin acyltransferase
MAFFSKKPPEPPPRSTPAPAPASRLLSNGKAPEPRNGAAAKPLPAAAPAPTPPSAEDVKAGMERSRRTLVALGEIVSVLMKSQDYRGASLATVQMMVGPPIASGQFMVLSAHDQQRGVTAPTALALWANVSDAVDRRLSDGADSQMRPEDWTSGNNPWIIVLTGDQRMLPTLLARLRQTALKDRPVKLRIKGEDGKMTTQTLPAMTAAKEKRA